MRKSTSLLVLLLLTAGSPPLGAQTSETNSFGNLNTPIPDGNPTGMIDIQTVSSAITKLSSLRVSLCVAGEFNGDLYGYLRHVQGGVTNFCILLNRVGRTASDPWGYADCGFNILFDDAAPQGDIHTYQTTINPPAGTPLTGVWQPDGRAVDPSLVLDTTPRTTYLSSFTNSNPSGEWTLFLADMSYGSTNMLVSWGLLFTGGALPPITWPTPANIVYGTALGAGQLNATSSVPGTFTYNPPAGTVLNAGSQVLSVTFNPTDTNSYGPVTANVALVVVPEALTISAANASKLYGAALPALTASYSGFVNGDTAGSLTTPPALTTTATAASPVGSYPITASGAASPNYTITYAGGTLSVNAAALTISAVNTSKLYGAALPALTASYSGFVNGDTAGSLTTPPALTTTATAASPVGSYPITASGAASSNYTITYASGTLSVNAAALTISAVNTSKLYGAALPALTAGYSGFLNGDTASSLTTPPVLTTTAAAASPVGSYPITASGAASPNYTITYAGGTLSVNAAALTISAVNTSKLYGAALPALTASYSGFLNGDTAGSLTTPPVLTTTATAASPVGSYPITASGAASPNYTINYASGTLSVNAAALTISAVNTSKLYGAALPALTASYSGFVNGDTAGSLTTPPALTTTATAASPVGSYPITASGAASPNYTITYASGTLSVNAAALTITAVSTSKLYGAALPALTASYSGFVNGDTAGSLTTPPALTTTATAASPVGSYPITASGAASPNYTITYAGGTLSVNAAALTISAANTSKLYGAALPALTASYGGFVNGDTASSLTTPPALTTTATAASPVGSYPITASGAASPNYTITYASGTLSVNAAALTVSAVNASKLYGAALPALTASYGGFVNGDTASSLTTPPTLSTTATAASPVGSYPIIASGAASSNYTISYASGTLSVNAAALTISAVNTSKLYGAALPALTASYSGFLNGDTASSLTTPPTLSTTATAASPVGSYPITASGAASSNYTITYASGTLSVNAAALTITAVNASKPYGAALPALTASYGGFVNGDTASSLTTPPALTTTATAASPMGSYPIIASGAASPNYTVSYASGTLTVNKAALTIAAANTSKLYGAALPALTASYSGFVNGDTASSLTTPPALTTTATAASPVGSYPITASGAASPNYTITYASGTLTVNKAALTIAAANTSKPYGAGLPALTASYSGFVNGDTASSLTTPPALTTTATAASPVGSYPIIASGAASPNYTVSYASGTLTVNKAALTITAANTSKPYGAGLPALTASYGGFVNGDTASSLTTPPALTTTATAASPVGSYPIIASGAASPNYTVSYASGTLTVNKAALTITAANTSKLYGAALPALTASYGGFVNGDTASSLTTLPALTTTATAASPVGSYPIIASGAASPNYTVSYASGTLTVNKAALTITAANTNKLYGAALPALTASYSGFVNGDTASSLTTFPALTTTATAASPVGSYPIIASGAASPNYTISYASGTLTVNKAALTITAANTNKLYGAALPALTASYSGFVNGDTASSLTTPPALTTTATATSPVGSYPIIASGAASPNYTIGYASGTLTVSKAALTITAANTSKLYGAALPALTASYGGFVNGDTASSLTTPPALTTTATATSPVGNYPIIARGAASPNYTISYASGTLTVSKAALTITAVNVSKLYGAAVPALTPSYSGFVNGDTASSLTTPPALTTTATAASPVGSYPIIASGAASPNYTFIYTPGTLVVTKASTAGLLSSSGNPSLPGQAVTFSVSLSAVAPGAGTPTGTVQFAIDGAAAGSPVSLSGGTASYTTTNLAHGSHTVAGQYAGDGNFLGITNLLSPAQVINTPPVAGPVTIYRGLTNGVKVTMADLLANVSDADGDAITVVGVSATSANGGTVVTNHGWVFYTPAPGFTNTDTFTYLATDGWSAPVAGTVTVGIRVDTGPSRNLAITNLGNGSVAIGGEGIPGRTYIIQYTTHMLPTTNWLTLGTVTADASGAFVLIDTSVSGLKFYRAIYP